MDNLALAISILALLISIAALRMASHNGYLLVPTPITIECSVCDQTWTFGPHTNFERFMTLHRMYCVAPPSKTVVE